MYCLLASALLSVFSSYGVHYVYDIVPGYVVALHDDGKVTLEKLSPSGEVNDTYPDVTYDDQEDIQYIIDHFDSVSTYDIARLGRMVRGRLCDIGRAPIDDHIKVDLQWEVCARFMAEREIAKAIPNNKEYAHHIVRLGHLLFEAAQMVEHIVVKGNCAAASAYYFKTAIASNSLSNSYAQSVRRHYDRCYDLMRKNGYILLTEKIKSLCRQYAH